MSPFPQNYGNFYGTSVKAVEDVASSGKVCILEIDVQGAESVRQTSLNPLYLFLLPPSFEALETRLRGRATEDEEALTKRLATAKKEIDFMKECTFADCKLARARACHAPTICCFACLFLFCLGCFVHSSYRMIVHTEYNISI